MPNTKQIIGVILIVIGILLLTNPSIAVPMSLVNKNLMYPTIDGKLIGATSPTAPDIIELSRYTNVKAMISSEGSFNTVKLRYTGEGGASGEINLNPSSSSFWETDWAGYIPEITRGVLYKLEWIGDGKIYITNYVIFGDTSASVLSVKVNGREIDRGDKLRDVYNMYIEATIEGVVRYVKAEVYKSSEGRWPSEPNQVIILDKLSGNTYGKAISLGEGKYLIIVKLDFGSRSQSSTVTMFYVENTVVGAIVQTIGVGLLAIGGYVLYKYREED